MSPYDIDWYLERLEGVEGGNGSWTAWCCCHDDVGSSHKGLSINVTQSGKILMRCHSPHCGATLVAVTAALDGTAVREEEDIKVNVRSHSSNGKAKATPRAKGKGGLAWYVEKTGVPKDIWEELGVIEMEGGVAFTFADMDGVFKLRKPPKDFIWIGTEGPNAPPLWPVPPDELPEHIFIPEGESDCGTVYAAGLGVAHCITKGAKTQLTEHLFRALANRGVREITLIPDADDSGDEFAVSASESATSAGLAVNIVWLNRVLDPFSGINDLNAMWRECQSVEQFLELVHKATEKVAERYPVLTMDELEVLAKEDVPWIIPGLLSPDDKVLISGPQKSYKTWVTLDLVRCLTSGTTFLRQQDWKPKQTLPTLFVQEEGGLHKWAQRIRRLCLDKKSRGNFHTLHRKGIRFTESDTIDFVISYCREHDIRVLIFDPLQRMIPGIDENDSSATGVVWDEVMRIQQALPGIVVILLHHANKTATLSWESVRGSSRHAGEVDLGIFLQKHPTESDSVRIAVDGRDIPQHLGAGETFEAKVTISRDNEPPLLLIDANQVTVNVNPVRQQAAVNTDKVLIAVADGCTTLQSIISQTGLSDGTCRKNLKVLVDNGKIEEHDNGEGKAKTYNIVPDEESDESSESGEED